MMNSRPARKDFSAYALISHGVLALVCVVVVVMYMPVVSGEASGEGAGMGVFLLVYMLGVPVAIAVALAVFFSVHSPEPGLRLPTALLLMALPVAAAMESDMALVVACGAYIAAVARAAFLRARGRARTG